MTVETSAVSKTQDAFERRDITALTRIGITKCRDLHLPVSTDAGAKNWKHAHNRYRTNRYEWIQAWITRELANPTPGDTGSRMMTRLRWRMKDEIRKEYAKKKRVLREDTAPIPKRIRRQRLPSREEVVDYLSTLEPPQDPVLRDLWERILAAYPNWKESTNRYLGIVCGVHPNVIASRRHALAVLYGNETDMQAYMLCHCLRIRVAKVRKTDTHRVEKEQGTIQREKIVAVSRQVGESRYMDWNGKHGEGTPVMVPVYKSIEHKGFIRQPRCSHIDESGWQCEYTQAKCPTHRPESTI